MRFTKHEPISMWIEEVPEPFEAWAATDGSTDSWYELHRDGKYLERFENKKDLIQAAWEAKEAEIHDPENFANNDVPLFPLSE